MGRGASGPKLEEQDLRRNRGEEKAKEEIRRRGEDGNDGGLID